MLVIRRAEHREQPGAGANGILEWFGVPVRFSRPGFVIAQFIAYRGKSVMRPDAALNPFDAVWGAPYHPRE